MWVINIMVFKFRRLDKNCSVLNEYESWDIERFKDGVWYIYRLEG